MKKIQLNIVLTALFGLGIMCTGCNSDENQMENAYEQTPEMTGDPDADPAEEDTSSTDGAL